MHPMYFEVRHVDTIDFIHDAYRKDLTVVGGLMAMECAALYVDPGTDVPGKLQFNR